MPAEKISYTLWSKLYKQQCKDGSTVFTVHDLITNNEQHAAHCSSPLRGQVLRLDAAGLHASTASGAGTNRRKATGWRRPLVNVVANCSNRDGTLPQW
mmetsp:Transcript_93121/g.251411  ORF Transcript_93121/g.251411 Transcript_93121/m.251411 type:complete len:98 (-) Transcript_93121:791-1084(-)